MRPSLRQQIFSNPLLMREIHRSPKPTLRAALIQTFLASAAVGYFMGIWLDPQSRIINLILFTLAGASLFIPPIVAFVSAVATLNDLNSQHFDLIRLTAISDSQMVQGYIASTAYQCRRLFSAALALAPLLFIRAVAISTYGAYVRCLLSSIIVGPCSLIPSLSTVLSFFAIIALLGANILALSLLAAALGVLLAGMWRSPIFSSLTAIFLSLITVGVLIAIAFFTWDIGLIFANIVYLAIICGLYAVVFQAARRFL